MLGVVFALVCRWSDIWMDMTLMDFEAHAPTHFEREALFLLASMHSH